MAADDEDHNSTRNTAIEVTDTSNSGITCASDSVEFDVAYTVADEMIADDFKRSEQYQVDCNVNGEFTKSLAEPNNSIDKVILFFRPAGNAPILRQKKFRIAAHRTWQSVIKFLRIQLHRTEDFNDPLFLYINSAFCPSPDELVIDLYNSFQSHGMLVISYSITPAWG